MVIIREFLSVFKSVKSELLVLSMRLEFLLIDLIACVRSRVEFFGLTCEMIFLGEAIPLLSFRFVVKAMFIDGSVDRIVRSGFSNWPF